MSSTSAPNARHGPLARRQITVQPLRRKHCPFYTFDPRLFTTWAEALKPITPPPTLRARLMARVRAEMGDEGLRTIRAGEGWVEFMPGIEFKMLYRDETTGARSLLARLDPGVAMPAHDHGFPEECLVLQGEITIGDITVCAGDYHFAAKGARHGTLTARTGVLLYLRAGRGEPVPELTNPG